MFPNPKRLISSTQAGGLHDHDETSRQGYVRKHGLETQSSGGVRVRVVAAPFVVYQIQSQW